MAAWGVGLVLLACSPVTSGDASTEGSSGPSSEGHETTGVTAGVDDTGTTGLGTTTTGGVPTSWCMRSALQLALDGDRVVLTITDADGDGRDEVWMAELLWDPVQELQSSRILAFELGDDQTLELILDIVRPGWARTMADVDGDGLHDVLTSQWNEPTWSWLGGRADPMVDETTQPLHAPSMSGSWLDADGDGWVDFIGYGATEIVLYMGDGTGGLTQTDALGHREYGSPLAHSSGVPGRVLVRFESTGLGFSGTTTALLGLAVSATGTLEPLVASEHLRFTVHHVSDLDGDEIPDAIGFDAWSYQSLGHAFHDPKSPGSYAFEVLDEGSIHGVVVGPLVSGTGVDLLYWSGSTSGDTWLRSREDEAWSTVVPVTVEGSWPAAGWNRTLQADGQGGHEILGRSYLEGHWVYLLWRLEPCD